MIRLDVNAEEIELLRLTVQREIGRSESEQTVLLRETECGACRARISRDITARRGNLRRILRAIETAETAA